MIAMLAQMTAATAQLAAYIHQTLQAAVIIMPALKMMFAQVEAALELQRYAAQYMDNNAGTTAYLSAHQHAAQEIVELAHQHAQFV